MKKVATQNGNLYYDGDGKKLSDVKVQDIETLEQGKKDRCGDHQFQHDAGAEAESLL